MALSPQAQFATATRHQTTWPSGLGNKSDNVHCRGDLCTGEEHAYSHTDKDHAATDEVPAQMAKPSGKINIQEHDVLRAAKLFLTI